MPADPAAMLLTSMAWRLDAKISAMAPAKGANKIYSRTESLMISIHFLLRSHRRLNSCDGSMIQPLDEGLHRSVHHPEEWSGVETDPENHHRQGDHDDHFTGMQVS